MPLRLTQIFYSIENECTFADGVNSLTVLTEGRNNHTLQNYEEINEISEPFIQQIGLLHTKHQSVWWDTVDRLYLSTCFFSFFAVSTAYGRWVLGTFLLLLRVNPGLLHGHPSLLHKRS